MENKLTQSKSKSKSKSKVTQSVKVNQSKSKSKVTQSVKVNQSKSKSKSKVNQSVKVIQSKSTIKANQSKSAKVNGKISIHREEGELDEVYQKRKEFIQMLIEKKKIEDNDSYTPYAHTFSFIHIYKTLYQMGYPEELEKEYASLLA